MFTQKAIQVFLRNISGIEKTMPETLKKQLSPYEMHQIIEFSKRYISVEKLENKEDSVRFKKGYYTLNSGEKIYLPRTVTLFAPEGADDLIEMVIDSKKKLAGGYNLQYTTDDHKSDYSKIATEKSPLLVKDGNNLYIYGYVQGKPTKNKIKPVDEQFFSHIPFSNKTPGKIEILTKTEVTIDIYNTIDHANEGSTAHSMPTPVKDPNIKALAGAFKKGLPSWSIGGKEGFRETFTLVMAEDHEGLYEQIKRNIGQIKSFKSQEALKLRWIQYERFKGCNETRFAQYSNRAMGSLNNYCNDHFSETDKLHIVWNLLQALQEVHDVNWVHGDVKPANILIFRKKDNSHYAVLSDFDACGPAGRCAQGDVRYVSPEDNNKDRYPLNSVQDCWTLGLTLYNFYIGKSLVDHLELILDEKTQRSSVDLSSLDLASKFKDSQFSKLDKDVQKVIIGLLCEKSTCRMTIKAAMAILLPKIEAEEAVKAKNAKLAEAAETAKAKLAEAAETAKAKLAEAAETAKAKLSQEYSVHFSFWDVAKDKLKASPIWWIAVVSILAIPAFLISVFRTRKELNEKETLIVKEAGPKKNPCALVQAIKDDLTKVLNHPAHIGFLVRYGTEVIQEIDYGNMNMAQDNTKKAQDKLGIL